jgi:hypothetical protein
LKRRGGGEAGQRRLNTHTHSQGRAFATHLLGIQQRGLPVHALDVTGAANGLWRRVEREGGDSGVRGVQGRAGRRAQHSLGCKDTWE